MENNTVYVVIYGYYSDQSVSAVFTDKAIAERYVGLYPDTRIQEIELNDFVDSHPGLLYFAVLLDVNGNVRTHTCGNGVYQVEPSPEFREHPMNDLSQGEYFYFYVWAKDDQHAIKIANERRAQMVAENRWSQPFDELRAQQSKYRQRSHLETDIPVTLRD